MRPERCDAYVEEVLKFRKALNLTSIKDAGVFETKFIKPSLALAAHMPEKGRMLDIGSGMGVPGIPLLIAKPSLTGVLVERRKKRAEFLRHVVRKLGLNAEVYDADVNALPALGVDVCVARAVTDEAELLRMCMPHVNQGAVAVLPVPRSQHSCTVEGWKVAGEYSVPVDDKDESIQSIRCYQYNKEIQSGGGFT